MPKTESQSGAPSRSQEPGRWPEGAQWSKVERSETLRNGDPSGERGPIGKPAAAPSPSATAPSRPDPEVAPKPARRRFTLAYKQRIVQEADACARHGELGALLRREGLYSSQLAAWRRQREQAVAEAECVNPFETVPLLN